MDRTGIIVVSLCAALLVFWFIESTLSSSGATSATAGAVCRDQLSAQSQPVTSTRPPARCPHRRPHPLILRHERAGAIAGAHELPARYTFTSRGGGLKLVELLDYPETISARWTKTSGQRRGGFVEHGCAEPVLAVFGDTDLVGDGNFTLTETGNGVRAEKCCRMACG